MRHGHGVSSSRLLGLAAWIVSIFIALSARAEITRSYVGIRFAESNPLTNAHDAAGGSIGVELGRHLGFELALDDYEVFLETPMLGQVAELNLLAFVPQIRLRYPVLHDRLIPYLVAGAGIAVTQVNDRAVPIAWRGGETDVRPVGTVAFGLEGTYVIAGSGTFTAGGEKRDVDLDAALLTFGLRLLFPERTGEESELHASKRRARFYLAARIGGATLVGGDAFSGVETTTEQPIFGTDANLLFGGALGVNIGRYAGVELSIEQQELTLNERNGSGLGEYALFPILLQPRLRYPLMNGRLEPYVLGGVGIELAEVNDSSRNQTTKASGEDQTLIGSMAIGLEYFISSDISIDCELKYVISRGHEIEVGGDRIRGNLDTVLLSFGLRAYLLSL